MKKGKKGKQLKWSMIKMLTLGWFVPLFLISVIMLIFVSNRMNRQLKDTILTSADKAIEICQIRLKEAMSASKDASYIPSIKESYAKYLQTGDEKELNKETTLFVEQQYRFNTDLNMTYLYFIGNPDNYCFTYQGPNTYDNVQAYIRDAKEEIDDLRKDLDTDIAFVNINNRVYMVRNIVDSSFTPFAVIVMELNVEHMFGSLESIWGYSLSDVFIDGMSMFHTYEKNPCEGLDTERYMKNSRFYEGEKNSFVYQHTETGRHKVDYVITLDKNAITDETVIVRYVLVLLLLFMIPLIVVVFAFFHQRVNKPIGTLRKAYKEIEKENYGFHLDEAQHHEEFADLNEAFNSMSDKLKYQFEKIYLEELALRDANIMALQSQINPHFLNNTLEIINWEARMADNYKVSAMIEALSTMLEATMNRKGEQLISLAEELNYADAYLYIISQRFGEKLEVTREIEESCLGLRVPRLIVQPILENAVEHGVDFRRKGQIRICLHREGDMLFIEIINNGKLSEEDRRKIEELLSEETTKEEHSVSLGIRNVNQRLKIMYGLACGLTIKSDKDGNTVSTITVKINNQ